MGIINITIVEYDNVTERLVDDIVTIPVDQLDTVKSIASVDADDPYVAYCYPLITEQLREICEVIGYPLNLNLNSSYFLEGHLDL
jgi:hypothetical protein